MTIKLAHQKLQLSIILFYSTIIWLVVGNKFKIKEYDYKKY